MKPENELKFSIMAVAENEGFARTAVSAFIASLDPRVDELADIRTAVSEAVTNAIVHAYRGVTGWVYVTVRIYRDREVYIQIKDKGCGIEDIEKAMTPLYTTSPCEERSGLGFAVMESFMDKLEVKSKSGSGTSVIMRKKLSDNERLLSYAAD